MAVVTLRAPLRDLAGGSSRLEVPGATVAEVIGRLEREHPRLAGWVLDERGRIREHVKVFVNGDVAGLDDSVAAGDQVHVLPAISGGRD
jgi:molybdopterin synthase sulfur carrier subunit